MKKEWLDKIKGTKGGLWIVLLMICTAALLLFPGTEKRSSIAMTEEEQRVSATLSRIAGAGEVRVSIYYAQEAAAFGSSAKTPVGAVIVAQGANQVAVRLNLIRAAETLLGLSAQEVDVFQMEDAP